MTKHRKGNTNYPLTNKSPLSFIVDDKILIMIGQQFTISENLPLHMLLYVARLYEKIVKRDDMYLKYMKPIPRPKFIFLYNGTDDMPEEQTVRLSDMFIKCGDERDSVIDLELTIKIYNINKGHNPQFAERSKSLNGYVNFVAKIREFEKESQNKDEAVEKAINYCIEHDILKNFLEPDPEEAKDMFLTEWDMDIALKVREEEGREEGRIEGIEAVFALLKKGMSVEEAEKTFYEKHPLQGSKT
jgi:hypothetical protein